MQLSEEQVHQFRKIYAEAFGIELDLAEAKAKATTVVDLLMLICVPITETSLSRLKEMREQIQAHRIIRGTLHAPLYEIK